MKALIWEGVENIVVKDLPEPPKPASGELLLRPLRVGICFSDRAAFSATGVWPPGSILGHEGSAEVVEVGPDVEGWRPGDRMTLEVSSRCGKCLRCRAGLTCERLDMAFPLAPRPGVTYWGMLTDYFLRPAPMAYKIPGEVSDAAAANVEPLACGTRIVRHSGIAVGDNVVVLGFEDYALSTMQWCKAAGAAQVIVVDPLKVRRDVARRLGADVVIDPTSVDPVQEISKLMPFGADIVFVSTEDYIPRSWKYFEDAIDIARTQGTVVNVRITYEKAFHTEKPRMAWYKEITIKHMGQFFAEEAWRGGRARGDYQLTIDALAKKKIDGDSYVSRVVPFDAVKTSGDVSEIFRSVPEKEMKVQFKIGGK